MRKALLLLCIVPCWLFACAEPCLAQKRSEPLFRVGTKVYTFEDIAGASAAELRARFRAETKGSSWKELFRKKEEVETEIRRKMQGRGNYFIDWELNRAKQEKLAKLPESERQKAYEEMLWHAALWPLFFEAINTIGKAAIVDNILEDQGINPEVYLDVEKIRKAVRRRIRYNQKVFETPEAKERDGPLREELLKMGVEKTEKEWLEGRKDARAHSPIDRWRYDWIRLSPFYEEMECKAELGHHLVKEVVNKGYYYKKALEMVAFDEAAFAVYEINGYIGDKAALEDFFQRVTIKGFIPEKAVAELFNAIKRVNPLAQFRTDLEFGPEIRKKNLPIGKLVETGPNSFQIIGWHDRKNLVGSTPGDNKAPNAFVSNWGYLLVGADFFPDIHVYSKHVPFDRAMVMRSLCNTSFLSAGCVKKPYPADLFDLFRDARSKRQTFTVRAGLAKATRNSKGAEEIVRELLTESEKPAPTLVQQRYRDMAMALAKEFGIEAKVPKTKQP